MTDHVPFTSQEEGSQLIRASFLGGQNAVSSGSQGKRSAESSSSSPEALGMYSLQPFYC